MKTRTLLLFLLISFNSFCQTEEDPLYRVDYEIFLKQLNSSIRISVLKSKIVQGVFDEKKIVFKTETKNRIRQHGISLKLSNDEILKFSNQEITIVNIDKSTYLLTGELALSDELLNKILEFDVVEYTLANTKVKIEYNEPEDLKSMLHFIFDRDSK